MDRGGFWIVGVYLSRGKAQKGCIPSTGVTWISYTVEYINSYILLYFHCILLIKYRKIKEPMPAESVVEEDDEDFSGMETLHQEQHKDDGK